jgi:hypothetical protein
MFHRVFHRKKYNIFIIRIYIHFVVGNNANQKLSDHAEDSERTTTLKEPETSHTDKLQNESEAELMPTYVVNENCTYGNQVLDHENHSSNIQKVAIGLSDNIQTLRPAIDWPNDIKIARLDVNQCIETETTELAADPQTPSHVFDQSIDTQTNECKVNQSVFTHAHHLSVNRPLGMHPPAFHFSVDEETVSLADDFLLVKEAHRPSFDRPTDTQMTTDFLIVNKLFKDEYQLEHKIATSDDPPNNTEDENQDSRENYVHQISDCDQIMDYISNDTNFSELIDVYISNGTVDLPIMGDSPNIEQTMLTMSSTV